MFLCRMQAWLVPLTAGALLRRLGGDTADKASTWLAKASGYLQHTESLQAAGIKLCLTLTSAATVWAAAMAVFVVEFGGDTLTGWVWSLLVWEPRYWLQVRLCLCVRAAAKGTLSQATGTSCSVSCSASCTTFMSGEPRQRQHLFVDDGLKDAATLQYLC
jgi:hypothetical protein